jgi:uncharacterized protein with HEPN domain
MSRRLDVVLEEILGEIDSIEDALQQQRRHHLVSERFLQRGIERSLEVISEAVRHVPDDVLAERPEIAWADIRSIGNVLRHEYWRIDSVVIANIVKNDLPALRTAVEAMLKRLSG